MLVRPYRAGRSVDVALREIVAHSGSQFNPKVVAALERLFAAVAPPVALQRDEDAA